MEAGAKKGKRITVPRAAAGMRFDGTAQTAPTPANIDASRTYNNQHAVGMHDLFLSIFINCIQGCNRTPIKCAVFIMAFFKVSFIEAYGYLKLIRSIFDMSKERRAVTGPDEFFTRFSDMLINWAENENLVPKSDEWLPTVLPPVLDYADMLAFLNGELRCERE